MVILVGGDGTTKEELVIALNANSELEGVKAEYDYLAEIFGEEDVNWKFDFQELIIDGNKW